MKSIIVKSITLAALMTCTFACDAEEQSASLFESELALQSSPNAKAGCLKACCETLKSRPQMHYTYYQNTGHFIGGSGEWAINTHGYSG